LSERLVGLQVPRLKFLKDALGIAGNEFRQFRRNRAAIIVSLVVIPLFFTATFGSIRGGTGSRFSATAQIPMAFVDNDYSTDSGQLRQALVSSGDFSHLVEGYREDNAIAALGTGRIYAAIVVPEGFQDRLANSQTAIIILYVDDGEPGLGDQVLSNLRKDVKDFNSNVEVRQIQRGLSQVQIIQRGAVFPGFLVGLTTVLLAVQVFAAFYEIAGGMSREREQGTYARLLASPVSLGSIIFGKTLYGLVLGTARTVLVLGLAIFVYGANPNTDLGTLLAISLLIALMTMGTGFLASALGAGTRAVIILEFFLVMIILSFTGTIDIELLRGISKTISSLLPWTYGSDALRRVMLAGQPLLDLTYDLQVIGTTIVAFYAVSYLLIALSRERLVA